MFPAILGIEWYQVENTILTWAPILFFGLIAFFMWKTVNLMPRTKPKAIKASTKSGVRWDDIAGVEATKDELREVVEFLSEPDRFKALGAKVP